MVSEIVSKLIRKAKASGRKHLLEPEAKRFCEAYGLPVPKFKQVQTVEEAISCAQEIGFPVVLKIISSNITHKSDVGGVKLNVADANQVAVAFKELMENVPRSKPDASISGVLVEQMAPSGVEVIVGVIKDSQFGHALMFGLGGVAVEVLKDVSFRICPVEEIDAREMIAEIKGYRLLQGYRNIPPADIESIVNILLNVSKMVTENPEIEEMDLNPIIVFNRGAIIADVRVRLINM